ncbi:unnamed protein product [Ectocarpus fasciculatus]
MKRNFLEFKNFLEGQYPQYIGHVYGGIHPPPMHAQYIAQIATMSWFGGIIMMFGGESIFSALGMAPPQFYRVLQDNKGMTMVGLFVFNSIGNSMLSTGAFEIYVDGELVFSKLKEGRFPNGQIIKQIFDNL